MKLLTYLVTIWSVISVASPGDSIDEVENNTPMNLDLSSTLLSLQQIETAMHKILEDDIVTKQRLESFKLELAPLLENMVIDAERSLTDIANGELRKVAEREKEAALIAYTGFCATFTLAQALIYARSNADVAIEENGIKRDQIVEHIKAYQQLIELKERFGDSFGASITAMEKLLKFLAESKNRLKQAPSELEFIRRSLTQIEPRASEWANVYSGVADLLAKLKSSFFDLETLILSGDRAKWNMRIDERTLELLKKDPIPFKKTP